MVGSQLQQRSRRLGNNSNTRVSGMDVGSVRNQLHAHAVGQGAFEEYDAHERGLDARLAQLGDACFHCGVNSADAEENGDDGSDG